MSFNNYHPIYYGGREIQSQESLNVFGAELINEQESIELLSQAMRQVAEYSLQWAQFMTPKEIVRQINENGENWWIEKEWVKAYSETFSL